MEFSGNISQNKYDYAPVSTIGNLWKHLSFYEGQEKTSTILIFVLWKRLLKYRDILQIYWLHFHLEQEYWYFGSIPLGEVDVNIGSETYDVSLH
jgi:hypothetical protein